MRISLRIFPIIIFALSKILFGCENKLETEGVEKESEKPNFLSKYKTTTLPISMKGCFGNSYKLPLISEDSLESDSEDGTVAYCTFKTNGDYFAVVRLGLSDCALPILITYDSKGNVIDEKAIGIGLCGASPGFRCEEFSLIKNDFSIFASDTIAEADLDSLGHEIKSTLQNYVIYKKGKLLPNGKIELTDTLRKILP